MTSFSIKTILSLALLLAGLAVGRAAPKLEPLTFETAAGAKTVMVEVAVTPQQRSVGLMYRRSMPDDQGMLFDFERDEEITMWMKNTYVSLDMVFVGSDGRITRIEEATEPLSTRVISSGGPARYVVELVAGAAARLGLAPGDRVMHPRVKAS